ncbi:protein of unknown function [Mucilaginibacter lappiensis]|uniref:DUF1835 domain-containing protein n=1 Tax=Mucilaginibacter lappiensis TaxID=354630 RepID=A0ABR6PN25_9SPHI|nr:DUF1835 domain-containing protein [Mucilaginibacter lappiensis]MBB6110385.1 hypothetical protein [Mucilaginibacter lappiensis]SIR32475.1 protein of unknown function [Mucilaginibacter lappiensis]
MSNILHILNGDAALSGFNETGLDGDVLVWREVLSEGPLQENILSGSFWSTRAKWITQTFKEDFDAYQHKVIEELGKLNSDYIEINLWFEFDLHCQVNLLGVLQMLSRKTDMSDPAIYLICLGDCAQFNFAKGLGELNGDQFEELYDSRERLNEWEFELANEAWQLYVQGDAAELEKWLGENSFWGGVPLLKPALEAHLKRLQVNEVGLGYIEQRLLDIYNSGAKTRSAIYATFWNEDKIFGMGDTEIDIYLDRLQQKQLLNL